MSKPIIADDGKRVKDRNGEFYEISSTYSLSTDPGMKRTPWRKLMLNIDELQNKPRRFFDTLLSLVEAQDLHQRERDYLVRGCEMWLSAVENGLYREVIRLSEPKDKEGIDLKREYEDDL